MIPTCYNHHTPVAMTEYVGFTERGGYFCKECELPAKAPVDPIDENAPPVFYTGTPLGAPLGRTITYRGVDFPPEFDSAWLGLRDEITHVGKYYRPGTLEVTVGAQVVLKRKSDHRVIDTWIKPSGGR